MTREDVQNLLMMFEGFYSSFKPDKNFKTMLVNTWLEDMREYDTKAVMDAFSAYRRSNTSGFAPTPAQLIEKIQLVNPPADIPTALEAWSLVSKALRNSGYHPEEEFAKLPPLVQKAVGSPVILQSWATDENYNEPVLSSQFMKDYRIEAERAKEILKLPENTRQQIAAKRTETAQIQTKGDEAQKYLSEKDKAVYGANKIDTPPTKPPIDFMERALLKMEG